MRTKMNRETPSNYHRLSTTNQALSSLTGSLVPVLSLFPCSIKVGRLAAVPTKQLIVKYVTIISTVSNIQSRALPFV